MGTALRFAQVGRRAPGPAGGDVLQFVGSVPLKISSSKCLILKNDVGEPAPSELCDCKKPVNCDCQGRIS